MRKLLVGVMANRKGGPEGVIDAVDERAPDGFTKIGQPLFEPTGARPQAAPFEEKLRRSPACGDRAVEDRDRLRALPPLRQEAGEIRR